MRPRAPELHFQSGPSSETRVRASELRLRAATGQAGAQSAAAEENRQEPASNLRQALTAEARFRGGKRIFSLIALVAACVPLLGCPNIPTPRSRASEAAREMNQATRWGRMDVALEATFKDYRDEFLKNHATWGSEVRILEAEMAGLSLPDSSTAIVQVDISWLLDDSTSLRVTRLEQKWANHKGTWLIEAEKRISGSTGLFGEDVERADEKRDKQFPTRVIR